MSIKLRQSIKKTSRGGLKMKTRGFIIGAFALVLVLVATGADAYVGNAGVQPSVDDFNFVNNIGTLTWGIGATEISIAVRVSAPDGDNGNFPSETYGSYFPDPLYGSFTASYDNVPDSGNGQDFNDGTGYNPTTGSTFDGMYGYFYTITLGDDYSGYLASFGFDIGPATITQVGYDENAGYQIADEWVISSNTLAFGFPLNQFEKGETAAVCICCIQLLVGLEQCGIWGSHAGGGNRGL